MNKRYETPELEIIECAGNVIVTSGGQTPGTDTDVDVSGGGTGTGQH